MNAHRWPQMSEIPSMDRAEAYDLYSNLPAPQNADQLAIIRALGDQGNRMRLEQEKDRPKRAFLPMPEKPLETAPKVPFSPRPKFKRKQPSAAKEERSGGAGFFLAALKS